MSPSFYLWSIGLMPMFASRAFLPAFLMSMFLLFPNWFPTIHVDTPVNNDSWLANPIIAFVLFVLTILEIFADTNAEIQEFMLQIYI